MIRGHVRDSFSNKRLDDFILLLSQKFKISIYIHTWNVSEARKGSSWRHLDFYKLFSVDDNLYLNYFSNSNKKLIKDLYVHNDSKINLIGNLEGVICKTKCPIIGWKRMFWGQFFIAKKVFDNKKNYDAVLSIRPDLFSRFNVKFENIIDMINNFKNKQISFLNDNINNDCIGVDNCFIGSVDFVFNLIKSMNENLDAIIDRYPNIFHQEVLVYYRSFEFLNEKN